MKRERLFSLKACTVLTGLLFLACLTAGNAGASHITSLTFSTESDWLQEDAASGTDFANKEKIPVSKRPG